MIKKFCALMFLSACAHAFSFIPYLGNNGTISSGTISNFTASTATVSRKITVPNGSASTDAAAFGQIFYGIQASSQCVVTVSSATTANVYIPTTLVCAITPTSASNRVRIKVTGAFLNTNTSDDCLYTIFNGSSDLGGSSNAGFGRLTGAAAAEASAILSIDYIDSPASASKQTYTLKIKSSGSTASCNFGNSNSKSVMILDEVR